jgi:hypothetical protein
MKNVVFWNVMPCVLGRTNVSKVQVISIIRVRSTSEVGTLAVTTVTGNAFHNVLIHCTLKMEVIYFSETSVLMWPSKTHTSEDGSRDTGMLLNTSH